MPGLALLFAPVTALFGPDVSYNLAAMLVPAVSAFTAYLLCRHVTRSTFASLVGGYLFGFSSYMLGQEQGHLHMTSVFLVPLIALATIRYLQGELDGRGVGWRLGVLFGLQFWLSTEIVVTAALALAVALVLAYPLLPATRARIRRLWRPLLGGAGLAAVIAAPLLYYLVTGFQSRLDQHAVGLRRRPAQLRCSRRSSSGRRQDVPRHLGALPRKRHRGRCLPRHPDPRDHRPRTRSAPAARRSSATSSPRSRPPSS